MQSSVLLHGRRALLRLFSVLAEEGHAAEIFDRQAKAAQRDRAAYLRGHDPEHVILGTMAERLLDRLEDCKRDFATAVVLGGAGESVLQRLINGRAGCKTIYHFDTSLAMLKRASWLQKVSEEAKVSWPKVYSAVADEEFLPLRPGSVDVIISCLGLHWVNDVPVCMASVLPLKPLIAKILQAQTEKWKEIKLGAMTQCRRALKPDGLFLACMWGGNTLQELRIACHLAEEEVEGGVSQRISPLAQVRDAGNLLTRAGLMIPSVDVDEVDVNYDSVDTLVQHLRLMGESNAVHIRQPIFRRQTWEATKKAYQRIITQEERESGYIPATFQAIYMTGWAPHERQQQPLARGSATVSFQDLEKELKGKGHPS